MKEERFRKFETVHAIGELLRKATGNENVGAYYDEDTDAVDVYLDDRLLVVVSVMGGFAHRHCRRCRAARRGKAGMRGGERGT